MNFQGGMKSQWRWKRAFLLVSAVMATIVREIGAFVPPTAMMGLPITLKQRHGNYFTSVQHGMAITKEDDVVMDDATLLKTVKVSQLQGLCKQANLSQKGSKVEMLERLRTYAEKVAKAERERILDRNRRVEGGDVDGGTKFEVINKDGEPDDDDDDDDEITTGGLFYFSIPTTKDPDTKEGEDRNKKRKEKRRSRKFPEPEFITRESLTAPPPPDVESNENGERSVTIYSTTDTNDLTGIAAAQPGSSSDPSNDVMMMGPDSMPSPLESTVNQNKRSVESSKELEAAKETVEELVRSLLVLTGAPAFREEFADGLQPMGTLHKQGAVSSIAASEEFVGFDPGLVPAEVLESSSKALRAGRGSVLQDVVRNFEIQAVGCDGISADDRENGGGHYQEVAKVRAFLEGFRKAEVRRVARETTTMLLDKLVTEGVQGLDFMLASMTKSSDDVGEAGELNDSLIDYLNDAIRQQHKRIHKLQITEGKTTTETSPEIDIDLTARLWNVTEEDGVKVESIDPNDPETKSVLKEELAKEEADLAAMRKRPIPSTAPAKLLLVLELLRDRIKVEASFPSDEHGRNLRVLAYCLEFETDDQRKLLIAKEMKHSMERLQSFISLVTGSIEYAQSAEHHLQPSKSRPLNAKLLKRIRRFAQEIQRDQTSQVSRGYQ